MSNSKSLEYLQCKERDLSAPTDFDIAWTRQSFSAVMMLRHYLFTRISVKDQSSSGCRQFKKLATWPTRVEAYSVVSVKYWRERRQETKVGRLSILRDLNPIAAAISWYLIALFLSPLGLATWAFLVSLLDKFCSLRPCLGKMFQTLLYLSYFLLPC